MVAEGGISPEVAAELAGAVDFVALGDELWSAPQGPAAALREIAGRLDDRAAGQGDRT